MRKNKKSEIALVDPSKNKMVKEIIKSDGFSALARAYPFNPEDVLKAKDKYKTLFNLMNQDIDNLIHEINEAFGVFIANQKKLLSEYLNIQKMEPEVVFRSPEVVANYLRDKYSSYDREVFVVFCLSPNNRILKEEVLFIGTVDMCQTYPRDIVRLALDNNATCIIIAHNHPSGDYIPSYDDIQLTNKVEDLLKILGIRLHDSIVTSTMGCYSIKAQRKIDLD